MARQLPRRVAHGLILSPRPATTYSLLDPAGQTTGAGDTAKPRSWGKAFSRSPETDSRPSGIGFGQGEPSDVAQRQRSRRPVNGCQEALFSGCEGAVVVFGL